MLNLSKDQRLDLKYFFLISFCYRFQNCSFCSSFRSLKIPIPNYISPGGGQKTHNKKLVNFLDFLLLLLRSIWTIKQIKQNKTKNHNKQTKNHHKIFSDYWSFWKGDLLLLRICLHDMPVFTTVNFFQYLPEAALEFDVFLWICTLMHLVTVEQLVFVLRVI